MGSLGSILRLQLLLGIGSPFWMLASADKRILLEPEYSLHERPPTQEREPLLIQVSYRLKIKMTYVQLSGEHQPAKHPRGVGEGAVGQP